MNLNLSHLPEYRCHKVVRAAKIFEIVGVHSDRPAVVVELEDGTKTQVIVVTTAWLERHKPVAGGYFVAYSDGYVSYSPAEAFEDGYALVQPDSDEPVDPVEPGQPGDPDASADETDETDA